MTVHGIQDFYNSHVISTMLVFRGTYQARSSCPFESHNELNEFLGNLWSIRGRWSVHSEGRLTNEIDINIRLIIIIYLVHCDLENVWSAFYVLWHDVAFPKHLLLADLVCWQLLITFCLTQNVFTRLVWLEWICDIMSWEHLCDIVSWEHLCDIMLWEHLCDVVSWEHLCDVMSWEHLCEVMSLEHLYYICRDIHPRCSQWQVAMFEKDVPVQLAPSCERFVRSHPHQGKMHRKNRVYFVS